MFIETLNKNEIYCFSCFKTKIISKIKDNKFICKHDSRYTFTLQWCDKCNDFTTHKGITGKCHTCNSPFKNYYNTEEHLKQARESCIKLSKEINDKNIKKFCKICNKETPHIYGGIKCSVCLGKNMNKVQNSFNELKFCEVCKAETLHISGGKICLTCHSKATGIGIQSFINGNTCIKHLKQEKLFYDRNKEQYICWDCFKEQFISNNKNNNFINDINKLYSNSLLQLTFREQNSKDWSNAKMAFEQDLIDKNILWFCYIKFYIDNLNKLLPLVVGKTGSKLVNCNGSDVNFSTDIEHGPARRFLKENNYNWDKTQIIVLPVYSEIEALNIESIIQQKYNLFYS